jgi:hypothetical protein
MDFVGTVSELNLLGSDYKQVVGSVRDGNDIWDQWNAENYQTKRLTVILSGRNLMGGIRHFGV